MWKLAPMFKGIQSNQTNVGNCFLISGLLDIYFLQQSMLDFVFFVVIDAFIVRVILTIRIYGGHITHAIDTDSATISV